VFNEDRKSINGMLLVHLPDGPTAQFRLSNLVLSKDIKVRLPPSPRAPTLYPSMDTRMRALPTPLSRPTPSVLFLC
jgi:ribosome production factor 1